MYTALGKLVFPVFHIRINFVKFPACAFHCFHPPVIAIPISCREAWKRHSRNVCRVPLQLSNFPFPFLYTYTIHSQYRARSPPVTFAFRPAHKVMHLWHELYNFWLPKRGENSYFSQSIAQAFRLASSIGRFVSYVVLCSSRRADQDERFMVLEHSSRQIYESDEPFKCFDFCQLVEG